MTLKASTTVFLRPNESTCALRFEPRVAGTYRARYAVDGNGLYSTLFVKSVDPGASIQVNYFETSLGNGRGERIDLESHTLVDASGTFPLSDQVIIPTFHRNLEVEAIVTGGSAEFGVYSSSKEFSVADKLLIENGEIPVALDAGSPFHLRGIVESESEVKKKVLEFTVPSGITRKLATIIVSACDEGVFTLEDTTSSEILALIVSTPSNATISFKFEPKEPIAQGRTLALYFTGNKDTEPVDVFGIVMANDI